MKINLNVGFTTPLVIQHIPAPTPAKDYRAIFTFQIGQFIFTGENMANTMQAGSYATLSIKWVDAHGNPAKVDGPTEWATSDDSIATIEVATGNPLIANVHAVGPIGPVQFQATADADLGEGVKSITATCDVNVIAGEASGGEIDFSQGTSQVPGGPGRTPRPGTPATPRK